MSETDDPKPQRPSHAESARTLMLASSRGVLSTTGRGDGCPYGSLVEYAPTDDGDAILLTSDLAEHTANFGDDARASLFVSPGFAQGRPLALERVTFAGEVEPVDQPDGYREAYLARHPHAAKYVDFSDFSFWRLRVRRTRYIGGFGRMSWVDEEAYRAARPDPLAETAAGAIAHMNDDHTQALIDYVRAFGDVGEPKGATMVSLDRFGFDVEAELGDAAAERLRISFDEPLERPAQVRKVLVELVQRARAQLGE